MSNSTNIFDDDDVMIIEDDSDDETSNDYTAGSTSADQKVESEDGIQCRNPWHDKWGGCDSQLKYPSQIPKMAQFIFQLLGYEPASSKNKKRAKFCGTCISRANNLTVDEFEDLEAQAKQKWAKQAKQLRMLAFVNPGRFMDDFDPERSAREMKKMNRRLYKEKNIRKNQLYDDHGLLLSTQNDLCDCLDVECPGCHFPCPKCSSEKCGGDCRCNRKWVYEYVESEGTGNTYSWPPEVK
ncbi:ARL14 effector protein-like isoform X4 [Ruditapes philippinarum]|uniref:ARL14 effector protein-like isoform X4 n=1 Tax=Ruditapes philippinarum TaxID=129788 RepID=UPI00295B8829|nr:ARL14 effector protein-like isoform X4 [Ruditapes philippinarum]